MEEARRSRWPSPPHPSSLKQVLKLLCGRCLHCTRKREDILITGDGEFGAEKSVQTNLLNWFFSLCYLFTICSSKSKLLCLIHSSQMFLCLKVFCSGHLIFIICFFLYFFNLHSWQMFFMHKNLVNCVRFSPFTHLFQLDFWMQQQGPWKGWERLSSSPTKHQLCQCREELWLTCLWSPQAQNALPLEDCWPWPSQGRASLACAISQALCFLALSISLLLVRVLLLTQLWPDCSGYITQLQKMASSKISASSPPVLSNLFQANWVFTSPPTLVSSRPTVTSVSNPRVFIPLDFFVFYSIGIKKKLFNWRLITLQYWSGFWHHWHELAMGVHGFPILKPLPTSLRIPSLRVPPMHQPWAPCLILWNWTGDLFHICKWNIHVSVLFSQIIPPSPSPTESKSLFFTSVSLLWSRI